MDISHQHQLHLLTGYLGVPGYIISTFLPSIQQFLTRQPRLVSALCILVALSTFGLTLFGRMKQSLLNFLTQHFMFTAIIDCNDRLYTYVLRWLQQRRKSLPEQELQARSREDVERTQASWGMRSPVLPNGTDSRPAVIYDFSGLQIFWHNWWPYFVSPYPRVRTGPPDYLQIRCFGFSSRHLKEIIDEAWKVNRGKDQAKLTAVYRPIVRSGGWKCVARRSRRSLETIVLDPKEKEKLLEDVTFYLDGKAKSWYAARGIPYRRGYLFHGPPGTGKTSLSMAIAGQFGLDIYIVSLLDPHINDTFLHTFFTHLPKRALILLEDIDSAGLARETFEKSLESYRTREHHTQRHVSATKVTLSGLLNAIDGADSPEGHLLIMTTNRPEALDEALIRPGRIDYKIGFRAISPLQARPIFMRMYQGDVDTEIDLEDLAEQFSEKVPDNVFTPAELQGHLLKFKRKPFEALENFDTWKNALLEERKQLEEAMQKEEVRLKKKAERRNARRKSAKAATGGTDSDSDSNATSSYNDAPEDLSDADNNPSNMIELNGDPEYADQSLGVVKYVDGANGNQAYPHV